MVVAEEEEDEEKANKEEVVIFRSVYFDAKRERGEGVGGRFTGREKCHISFHSVALRLLLNSRRPYKHSYMCEENPPSSNHMTTLTLILI